jgi:hypothetical protein
MKKERSLHIDSKSFSPKRLAKAMLEQENSWNNKGFSADDFIAEISMALEYLSVEHGEEVDEKDKRITGLEAAFREMSEALEFYAAEKNWYCGTDKGLKVKDTVIDTDWGEFCEKTQKWLPDIGGKRARQALLKHAEIISKIKGE